MTLEMTSETAEDEEFELATVEETAPSADAEATR